MKISKLGLEMLNEDVSDHHDDKNSKHVNLRESEDHSVSSGEPTDVGERNNMKKRAVEYARKDTCSTMKKQKMSANDRSRGTVEYGMEHLTQEVQGGEMALMRHEIAILRKKLGSVVSELNTFMEDRMSKTDSILLKVLEQMKEVRGMLSLNSGRQEQGRRRGKSQIQHVHVPLFNHVFSDDVVQVVIEKFTIEHLIRTLSMDVVREDEVAESTPKVLLPRKAATAVRIMMFAVNLRNRDGRALYLTELGKRFSEFREGMILTALNAAKKNTFQIFRKDEDVTIGGHIASNDSSEKAGLPHWLKNNCINREHISITRIKLEETVSKTIDEKINAFTAGSEQSVEDMELAMSASDLLYKTFTRKIGSARTTARWGFFDEVGYLFTDWASLGGCVNQSTLKVRWLFGDKSPKYENIEEVPETHALNKYSEHRKREDRLINRQNKTLLQNLMLDFPEMIIRV